jgi:starch phosphorylase
VHASTAREIWAPAFPDQGIDYVTNGAHLATFLSEPMASLFDRHLGARWRRAPADESVWEPVRGIPNGELWAARCEARARLIERARAQGLSDRLLRGEDLEYARAAARGLDPQALTLGFARRLAAYKRLDLLFYDPLRLGRIVDGEHPCQLLIAGKAHPHDDEGKRVLQRVYSSKENVGGTTGRTLFLEDYDLSSARELVAGCDVWINLPRPPLEASGTSGMKSVFNGGIQLSVVEGWWAEGYNGHNGWGIHSNPLADRQEADAEDADRLYSILEHETIPRFYERDADGVPNAWCELMKESIVSCAPRFTATRMLQDYIARMYVPAG